MTEERYIGLAAMLVDPDLPYNPWDRLPGEPIRWYARFEQYFRPMGPSRTLLAASNSWRTIERGRDPTNTVPQAWAKAAKDWEWRLRAELWDAAEMAELRRQEAELRQEWRDRRRDVLVVFVGKFVDAIEAFVPDQENPPTLGQLTSGFRAVMDQVRAEFSDTPVEKSLQVQVPVRRRHDSDDSDEPEPASAMTDGELQHELDNILAVLQGLPARSRTQENTEQGDEAGAESGDDE